MASDDQANPNLRLKDPIPPCPPLPYIPPSISGKLLSSWSLRIAAEYNVNPQHLVGHIGLSVSRAREIDSALPADDVCSIALALCSHPAEIRDHGASVPRAGSSHHHNAAPSLFSMRQICLIDPDGGHDETCGLPTKSTQK
jgi:hypothetical protein